MNVAGITRAIYPHVLPGLIEDPPMYRAVLEFAEPIKEAAAFGSSTELQQNVSRVEAMVSDVHEVIIVKY